MACHAQYYLTVFYPSAATDVGLLDEHDRAFADPAAVWARTGSFLALNDSRRGRRHSGEFSGGPGRASATGYRLRCPPALQYLMVPFMHRAVAVGTPDGDALRQIIFSDTVSALASQMGRPEGSGALTVHLLRRVAASPPGQADVHARNLSASRQAAVALCGPRPGHDWRVSGVADCSGRSTADVEYSVVVVWGGGGGRSGL